MLLKDTPVSARVEYGGKPEAEALLQKLGIRVFVVIKSLYRHFLKTHEKHGFQISSEEGYDYLHEQAYDHDYGLEYGYPGV